jgi:NTE family protein
VTQINHKYTLVLGGGGARGIAHLGILRVLERERLLPSLIVGTSIGAVIGSMFSQTLNSHECERRIESLFKSDFFKKIGFEFFSLEDRADRHNLLDHWITKAKRNYYLSRTLTHPGALPDEVLSEAISSLIEDTSFEDIYIPFAAIATDLENGEPVILRKGSLRDAVTASASIPAISTPKQLNNRTLIDGGASCITPVIPARRISPDPIIAVDVWKTLPKYKEPTRGLSVLLRAGEITQINLNKLLVEQADVVIRPDVNHFQWTQFEMYQELIQKGMSATEMSLDKITAEVTKEKKVSERVRDFLKL